MLTLGSTTTLPINHDSLRPAVSTHPNTVIKVSAIAVALFISLASFALLEPFKATVITCILVMSLINLFADRVYTSKNELTPSPPPRTYTSAFPVNPWIRPRRAAPSYTPTPQAGHVPVGTGAKTTSWHSPFTRTPAPKHVPVGTGAQTLRPRSAVPSYTPTPQARHMPVGTGAKTASWRSPFTRTQAPKHVPVGTGAQTLKPLPPEEQHVPVGRGRKKS